MIHVPCASCVDLVGRGLQLLVHRVTLPLTGEKRSLTAFTLSTEPKVALAVTVIADLGRVDVNNVAQRVLRVIGDANRADGAINRNPFVLAGVAIFVG